MAHNKKAAAALAIGPLSLAALVTVASTYFQQVVPGGQPGQPSGQQAQQPRYSAPRIRQDSGGETIVECRHEVKINGQSIVAVAAGQTNIPEFNDCQRLLAGGSFRTLAGLWTSYRTDSLLVDMFPGSGYTQDSLSTDSPLNVAKTLIDAGHQPRPVVALQVYAYDGGYAPLGLQQGYSCVYLSFALSPRAVLLHRDTANSCPRFAKITDIPGVPLNVNVYQPKKGGDPDFRFMDYPASGRWEWDRVNKKFYMGTKCGAAWCEFSRGRHNRALTYNAPLGVTGYDRRVYRIPGWYDQQILAVNKAGTSPTAYPAGVPIAPASLPVVPDTVIATIFPVPNLRSIKNADLFVKPTRVATVVLTGNSMMYGAKNNFYPPKNGKASSILLQDFTTGNPGPVDISFKAFFHAPPGAAAGTSPSVIWKWATYHEHPGWNDRVPATARWHWWDFDDTNWGWCDPAGCCDIRNCPGPGLCT